MDIQLTEEQQKIVLENQRLVHYIVNRLGVSQSEHDDIASIGMIGLMKAAATFEVSKNFKFATYATMCIKNEIFMSFRKSNKHSEVLSFEEIVFEDDNDGLDLGSMLSDPKSLDFEEQLEDAEVIANALNYVLNCLPRKIAIILLFSMAGIGQKIIGDIMETSQSYVSRLIQKYSCKLKENYEEKNNCKEVFKLELKNNRFKITFSTADVKQFNTALANFLTKNNNVEELPHFKIDRTENQVTIYLNAEPESLAFIACIIKEIETFSMNFGGIPKIASENDEKGNITVKENHTKVKDEDNTRESTTNSETTDSEEELQVKSSILDLQPEIQNVDENAFTKANSSNTKASITNTASSTSSMSKQVKEYMLSKDSFFVREIREKFPNTSSILIRSVLHVAKSRGLIFSDERGHYIVKK